MNKKKLIRTTVFWATARVAREKREAAMRENCILVMDSSIISKSV